MIGSSNNLIAYNTIVGGHWGIYLSYSDECIIANNTISETATSDALALHHSSHVTIIGNQIYSPPNGGITLYESSTNNIVQGNYISDTERGIALFYETDDNTIENNDIFDCKYGIILDNVEGNIICRNNLSENVNQGFDNGDNSWNYNGNGNYWSDYPGIDADNDGLGDTPYIIPDNGSDHNPVINMITIESVSIPDLKSAPFDTLISISENIQGQIQWENQDKTIGHIDIFDGNSLTIRNCSINFTPINTSTFAGLQVDSGAALYIYNSKIYANGKELSINKGAIFEMTDSELHYAGNWISGNGLNNYTENVVFERNLITHSLAVTINANSIIEDNRFVNGYNGIVVNGENSIIENNQFKNLIRAGIELNQNDGNNSIINNTIQNTWKYGIYIGYSAINNSIYLNNFHSYQWPSIIQGHDPGNIWNFGTQGNYWSDYLDKYPYANESSQYPGTWDIPYENSLESDPLPIYSNNNIDDFPLINLFWEDSIALLPTALVLEIPMNNSTNVPINPLFSWNPSADAESYRILVSTDSNFYETFINQKEITTTQFHSDSLFSETLYFWRVIAQNSSGYSGWSETRRFITEQVAGIQPNKNIPKSFTLFQNYPNPFNVSTTFEFDLPKKDFVSLKIFDIQGQEIDTILNEEKTAGHHKIIWDANNLSTGLYFYQIYAGDFKSVKKCILLK